MADLSFPQLLYRYLFHTWLFRDVTRGNLYERAASWRYNQQQAHWLPRYIKRWVVLGGIAYLLGFLIELAMQSPVLSAFFYVPSALSVSVNAVLAVSWLGLKLLPAPL